MHKTVALVVLAVVLPLPLILLISPALYPDTPSGRQASPLMPADQARKLPSYGQDCLRSIDCDPPLGCLELGETGRGTCLNTQCETNTDCEPSEYCRSFQTLGNSLPLRGCERREGQRMEGEPCAPGLAAVHERCAAGLFCNKGWCGRPCNLSEPTGCPAGFFCQHGLDGPSCVPTCEDRACPEGLQCAREAGGISVCASVQDDTCSDTPCPEGSRCTFTHLRSTDAGLTLRLECVSPCGEGLLTCPSGQFCLGSRCRRTCDPQHGGTCPSGERCVHRVDLGISLCK
jgi:hypothetical protein